MNIIIMKILTPLIVSVITGFIIQLINKIKYKNKDIIIDILIDAIEKGLEIEDRRDIEGMGLIPEQYEKIIKYIITKTKTKVNYSLNDKQKKIIDKKLLKKGYKKRKKR